MLAFCFSSDVQQELHNRARSFETIRQRIRKKKRNTISSGRKSARTHTHTLTFKCRQRKIKCGAVRNGKVIFSCIISIFGWVENYDIDLGHVQRISCGPMTTMHTELFCILDNIFSWQTYGSFYFSFLLAKNYSECFVSFRKQENKFSPSFLTVLFFKKKTQTDDTIKWNSGDNTILEIVSHDMNEGCP